MTAPKERPLPKHNPKHKKPRVRWNDFEKEWQVWRGTRLWYSSKDWVESYGHAVVLAQFRDEDTLWPS